MAANLLYQLVYCSICPKHISQESIENLLLISQNFNTKNNITGCIVFHNFEFVQLFEGTETAIDSLYNLVAHDIRHKHITIIDKQLVTERSFDKSFIATDLCVSEIFADQLEIITINDLKSKVESLPNKSTTVKVFSIIISELTKDLLLR